MHHRVDSAKSKGLGPSLVMEFEAVALEHVKSILLATASSRGCPMARRFFEVVAAIAQIDCNKSLKPTACRRGGEAEP